MTSSTTYNFPPLLESDCPAEPFALFENWFSQAQSGRARYPNAMNLATVDQFGDPDSRIVLLKSADKDGFVFYTNSESAKGRALAAHPMAALNFYWDDLMRQVRVRGPVEILPASEADTYFASRPLGSRLGAHASQQSRTLRDRDELEQRLKEIEFRFPNGEVPRPSYWNGYRLVPQSIEFWQERESRLHDRIFYKLEGSSWTISRLSP